MSATTICCMGGVPHEAFFSVTVSPEFDVDILDRLVGGLQASGSRFGVQLAGGDTASTPGPTVLSLTLEIQNAD